MSESTKNIDLVCGMDTGAFKDALFVEYQGKHIRFCGSFCRDRFFKKPQRYFGTPIVEAREVKKIFHLGGVETPALQGLNMRIWKGDFVAIIGASGSGKSTCLNMIGLLDRPSSGELFLNGKNVAQLIDEERSRLRSQEFGFVFQQYNLIPWFSAYENVTLPLIFAGLLIDRARVEADFESIGLGARKHHHSFELSGGEQQRVALLRALVNDPEVIIGDEPTGNLDSATGDRILELLIELNKKMRKTLIIVTHDADIANQADQIIALKDGLVIRNHSGYKMIYTE